MMKLTKRQALALSTYYNEVRKLKSIKGRAQLTWRIVLNVSVVERVELETKYPSFIV